MLAKKPALKGVFCSVVSRFNSSCFSSKRGVSPARSAAHVPRSPCPHRLLPAPRTKWSPWAVEPQTRRGCQPGEGGVIFGTRILTPIPALSLHHPQQAKTWLDVQGWKDHRQDMCNLRGPCRQAGPEEVVRGDRGDTSEAFQPPMERNGAALPPKLQLRNDPEGRRMHPLRERERLLALDQARSAGRLLQP